MFGRRYCCCLSFVPSGAPEPPCLPGDLLVTPVYSGFLLARVIPKVGLGPWWTFIKVVENFNDAVEQARTLALAEGVGAWSQEGHGRYEALLMRTAPRTDVTHPSRTAS